MAKSSGINKFLSNTDKYAGKKSDMVPPKSGSYAPPTAEKAKHTSESIPPSAWSDRSGNSMTSRQPAAKYPAEATSMDNAYAKALLATDTSNQRRKPDIFK